MHFLPAVCALMIVVPFSGPMAFPYIPSLSFLLRFFAVWVCLGRLWPRVRCALPVSSSFLFANLLCAWLLSTSPPPWPLCGTSMSSFSVSCFFLRWHGASQCCSWRFTCCSALLLFLVLFSSRCVLAALVLDGRLEPQAPAAGEVRARSHLLVLTTKPNQAKPSQTKPNHIANVYTDYVSKYPDYIPVARIKP